MGQAATEEQSLPTVAPISSGTLDASDKAYAALQNSIPPEVPITASPYSRGTDPGTSTLPSAKVTPQTDANRRPFNDSVEERRHARNTNTWASVSNTIANFSNKQNADKQAALTSSIATVMKANQQIDNAKQVLASPTSSAQDKAMAQQVIDKNKTVIEGKLTDSKTGKAIQKAFDISPMDPEAQNTPEYKAAQAAHKQVQAAAAQGLNADTPAEKAIQDKASGNSTPNPAPQNNPPAFVSQSYPDGHVPGMERPGNVDIANRPIIKNPDGSSSTVFSMSFDVDGKEVLVPGVGDGKTYPLRKLTTQEALDQYKKTGKQLGVFNSPKEADAYAEKLHEDQAKQAYKKASSTPYADKFLGSQPATISGNPEYDTQMKQKAERDKLVTQYVIPKMIQAQMDRDKVLIQQEGLSNRTEYAGIMGMQKQAALLINEANIASGHDSMELKKQAAANAGAMARTKYRVNAMVKVAEDKKLDPESQYKVKTAVIGLVDKQVSDNMAQLKNIQDAISQNKYQASGPGHKVGDPIDPKLDASLKTSLQIQQLAIEQSQDMAQKTRTQVFGTPVINPNDPTKSSSTDPYTKVQSGTERLGYSSAGAADTTGTDTSDGTESDSDSDTDSDREEAGEERDLINSLLSQ
jgi:hypothetical protein